MEGMNEIKGTIEDARAAIMTPKTRLQVKEALQNQIDSYGDWEEPDRNGAAAELEATAPTLAARIRTMPEEAGAACYMAARMLRECYWLIIQQQTAAERYQQESDSSNVVQIGQTEMDISGTLKLFGTV